MKEFPDSLNVSNKDKFPKLAYERWKCYLRRDLYEHILSHKPEDYFSLDKFNSERVENMDITRRLINDLIPELESFGWTCTLSFGGTGLFIYTDEKPANCWEGESLS